MPGNTHTYMNAAHTTTPRLCARAHTHTHRLVFIEAVSSHFPVVGFKHSTLLSVLSAESNPPTAYSRPFRAARPSARRCASDATLLHTPVRLSKHSTVVTPATAWPPTANNLPHPSARREYLRKEHWGQHTQREYQTVLKWFIPHLIIQCQSLPHDSSTLVLEYLN